MVDYGLKRTCVSNIGLMKAVVNVFCEFGLVCFFVIGVCGFYFIVRGFGRVILDDYGKVV